MAHSTTLSPCFSDPSELLEDLCRLLPDLSIFVALLQDSTSNINRLTSSTHLNILGISNSHSADFTMTRHLFLSLVQSTMLLVQQASTQHTLVDDYSYQNFFPNFNFITGPTLPRNLYNISL